MGGPKQIYFASPQIDSTFTALNKTMSQEIKTKEELIELMKNKTIKNGLYSVKSRIFLESLERKKSPAQRELSLIYPPVTLGSPSIFEATIISLFVTLLEPCKIVEFGTYTGYTTAILAKNSNNDTSIISIDLPAGNYFDKNLASDNILLNNWKENDNFLKQKQSSIGEIYIKSLSHEESQKIKLVKNDSTLLNNDQIAQLAGAEFIFIDGGHSFETVNSDSNMALASMTSNGVVLWHDYGSTIHSEVTEFINKSLSKRRKILHIKGTSLALLINGDEALKVLTE